MLRFYRQAVIQLLFTLLYLKDRMGPINGQDIRRNAMDNWTDRGNMRFRGLTTAVRGFFDRGERDNDFEFNTDELIQNLTDKLNTEAVNDTDLIDTIVRTLKLPYAGNTLSGKTIDSLKKALLLPDELAGLKDRLVTAEMSCNSCARPLETGEMTVIGRDPNGLAVFMCIRCAFPRTMGCNGCEGRAPIAGRVAKAIEKASTCQKCIDKRNGKITQEPEPERMALDDGPFVDELAPPDDGPLFGRIVVEPFRGAQAAQPPPINGWQVGNAPAGNPIAAAPVGPGHIQFAPRRAGHAGIQWNPPILTHAADAPAGPRTAELLTDLARRNQRDIERIRQHRAFVEATEDVRFARGLDVENEPRGER